MAMAPGAPDRLTSPGPEPLTTWWISCASGPA